MCLVHSGIFLSRGLSYAQPVPGSQMAQNSYLLIGFFSICLPALAGSSLRAALDKFYVSGKVLNYDFKEILVIALALIVLESIKNGLAYHSIMSFTWDVLHFIALSLVITVALMIKWGTSSVYFFAGLSLVLGAVAPALFSSAFGAQLLGPLLFLSKIIFRILVLLGPTAFILWITFKVVPRPPKFMVLKRVAQPIVGIAIGATISFLIWRHFGHQIFFKKIAEVIPFAAFFKLPVTIGHMWPLFPWYALVGVGFILTDISLRSEIKSKALSLISLVSFLGFATFLVGGFENYRTLMVENHYFSAKVFAAPPMVMIGILCFYSLIFSVLTLILDSRELHSKIIANLSRGLLLFYFVHFLFALSTYPVAVYLLGKTYAMYFFPWIVMLFSYFIMTILLQLVGRPLQILLRRRA